MSKGRRQRGKRTEATESAVDAEAPSTTRRFAEGAAAWGAGWLIDKLRFAPGILFVGVGGAFLSAAWLAGPQRLQFARELTAYTGRAEAHPVHPFWRFEVDLPRLQKGTNWPVVTTAELCAELEVEGAPAGAPPTLICGARRTDQDSWGLLTTDELAPGVPIAWPRDERGFPVVEIRFSPGALPWLTAHQAFSWPLTGQSDEARQAMPPPGSDFDALMLQVDRPLEWLVRSWSAPTRIAFVVAFVPAAPNRAVPVSVVEQVRRDAVPWFMVVVLGLIGLAVWSAGMAIAFGSDSRWRLAAFVVVPLLALPWWGSRFEPVLLWLAPNAGQVGADMVHELTDPLRLPVEARDPASLAGFEVKRWSLADSYYDDLAGPFAAACPQPPPADPDAALAAAVEQVTAHMDAARDDELLPLLQRLRHDELFDRGEVGLLFLDGARRAALDEARPRAVRQTAGSFLWWLSVTPIEPEPSDPAFATRVRLWKELLDFPDPAVANDARDIVESAEAPPH
jgi:hypothetical protein